MKFNRLVNIFSDLGDFNNPDMSRVDNISKQLNVSQIKGRQAFFTARDLRSLREHEIMEGGSGKVSNSINRRELLESTLSRGERLS